MLIQMGIFDKQIAFVDSLDDIIRKSIFEAFSKNEYVVEDYITENQLYNLGEDGNKVRLQGYTRATIRLKIAKKQPADRTTLKDTGKFYMSLDVQATENGLKISSNVKYDINLRKRYGKAIYIPSTDNIEIFVNNYIIPTIKENIKDYFV